MSATEPTTETTETDERSQLTARYPNWCVWVSSANRPWATRRGGIIPSPGEDHPKDARWKMTVDSDSWDGLEREIKEQTDLDAGTLLKTPV